MENGIWILSPIFNAYLLFIHPVSTEYFNTTSLKLDKLWFLSLNILISATRCLITYESNLVALDKRNYITVSVTKI